MRNVMDAPYGAVGDGVADDTAAIQAALDVGPGVVEIPAGSYKLSAYLRVRADRTIVAYGAYLFGTGHTSLVRNCDHTTDSFAEYDGNSNVSVFGGIWDNKGQLVEAGTDEGHNCFTFNHARNIHVEDVVIRNIAWSHAIELNAIDGAQIVNCRAEGFKDTSPLLTRGKAEAFQIDVSATGSTGIGLWDNTPTRNATVRDCYSGPSAELGTYGTLVGSHTGITQGITYDNIQVVNCRVDSSVLYAVTGECWRDFLIEGNTFNNTGGTTIYMNESIGGIISGNNLRNAGSNAINVTGTNGTVITGNSINGPAAYGVYLSSSNDFNVTDNWIYGAGTAAVRVVNGSHKGDIRGNTLRRGGGGAKALWHDSTGSNVFVHNDVSSYGSGAGVIDIDAGTVKTTIGTTGSIGHNWV